MARRWVSPTLSIRTVPEAREKVNSAIFQSIQEVFELDIKPDAVANSPVRRGTNRRSIDVTVERTANGVKASLYTQSGYGGYLELGTRYIDARPYLYPAFQKFFSKIGKTVKGLLSGRR